MIVAADSHVHLYPEYDLAHALRSGMANLARLAEGADPSEPRACALFLTERSDCHVFRDLRAGAALPNSIEVVRCEDPGAIEVRCDAGSAYLFPGRQVATRERLEVLCLTADADIPDGLGLEETLERVRSTGGIPVIPFAPGKWLGARGRLLERTLGGVAGGAVLVSDSALRPFGWPRPRLMLSAGAHVLAGSDPLPLAGDELRLGTYATLWRTGVDWRTPTTAARALLRTPPTALGGARLSPWALAWRLRRLAVVP